MLTKLLHIWQDVRTSFWFIPGLMVLGAIILAQVLIGIDNSLEYESFQITGILFTGGPEGARSVLSTIAGSMISIAGLTFSITIVALTLASSQFGPRMMRNFMKDPRNQVVLGTFISTFIYCLLILGTVRSIEGDNYVPRFSIVFSMILALGNVGILIFFIHYIATSIQADSLIASVYTELVENVKRLFPEEIGEEFDESEVEETEREIDRNHRSEDINASKAGYLQAMDSNGLVEIAREADIILNIHYRPGEFVVEGSKLVTVRYDTEIEDNISAKIADCFILGRQRSPEQDAEFAIYQLVEIAGRALSPGINDPFTALTCIDRLGSALCNITNRVLPSANRYDSDKKLRVVAKPITFSGVTNAAFDQIRQYGRSNVAITIRLLEALIAIASQAKLREHRQAIKRQADMIYHGSKVSLPEKQDRLDVRERYQMLIHTLRENQKEIKIQKKVSEAD